MVPYRIVSLSLPPAMLAEIDVDVKSLGMNRSKFFRNLYEVWKEYKKDTKKKGKQ